MEAMFRRVVVLAVALALTLAVFLSAGYFGAVWGHYFSDEPAPPQNTGEVSVKIISPNTGNGLCDPHTSRCPAEPGGTPAKPHG